MNINIQRQQQEKQPPPVQLARALTGPQSNDQHHRQQQQQLQQQQLPASSGYPPQTPSHQIDWIHQINQDPVIADLRRWINEAGRLPGPDEEGNPRQPQPINTHTLPNGEHISCVYWNGRHYITGTDIVKVLLFRFHHIGRGVSNIKKFEEGVFSDLRNLKPGVDAVLEDPKSPFLEFLYKHNCIRTQKKQKVFFWYKVPHDALFRDAIERDLKREASLYQTVHYLNMNSRMMRPTTTMAMLPVQMGSPGGGAPGLAAIAPQPTAYIDPNALFAALSSPQAAASAINNPLMAFSQQPPAHLHSPMSLMSPTIPQSSSSLKRPAMGGTVDPSQVFEPSSVGPQPNTPFSQPPQSSLPSSVVPSSSPAAPPSRDHMMFLEDPTSSLLCGFPDDCTDSPLHHSTSFSMDQFVDFTSGGSQEISPRDNTSGLAM